jgi:alcohol dehydrogenase (cytochrome c)
VDLTIVTIVAVSDRSKSAPHPRPFAHPSCTEVVAMNCIRAGLRWSGLAACALTVAATAAAQQANQGPWSQAAWTLNAPTGQWLMTGRDYGLTRFSPLKQITTENVKNLKAAWTFSTGTLRGHEGNPLVVGNVMYVHTSFPNIVYALDLSKPGAPQIWKHVPNQSPDAIPIACCDLVNRGLAYSPSGKVYIQLLQGELLALDAKTGKELWKAKHPDSSPSGQEATGYKQGATMTNAPIYIKTKSGKELVIAGISGGEFGVRGRVSAFDANSGQHVWTMYSTGPDAEVGIKGDANANYASHKGKDLGVSTWQGDEWKRGGGTTWGWYSYDPQLDLFYYSSGNPGTWNPDQRPGDNKWSMTIFARHPDDGTVAWAYQMTPHDEWDYDGVNENVLVDLNVGGKPTKALVHFDRNGFGYTLDRTNGKLLVAKPYGPVNWAKSVDLTTGVPQKDPRYGTTSKKNTEGICPAAIGFKDQQPSAYSPMTGLFYVPANHICMDYEGVEVKYSAGQPYVGAIVRMFPGPGGHRGRFIAWDPTTGTVKWEVKENLAAYGGALTTAGGLVFYGTMEGWLKALDQKTGKELWRFKTPSGIIGNPMTYTGPDGQQYVAVLSGIGGWAGIGVAAGIGAEDPTAGLGALGAFGDAGQFSTQGGVLTVFSLNGPTSGAASGR